MHTVIEHVMVVNILSSLSYLLASCMTQLSLCFALVNVLLTVVFIHILCKCAFTAPHSCHDSSHESFFSLCSTPVHSEKVDIHGAVVKCEELGLLIVLPPGAVNSPVTISVGCFIKEKLDPPNGYEFVSPVYLLHIDPEVKFHKKVTLSLDHWAKPSISSLSFGFRHFPTTKDDYSFVIKEGGDFISNDRSGRIDVDHFWLGVILRKLKGKRNKLNVTCLESKVI